MKANLFPWFFTFEKLSHVHITAMSMTFGKNRSLLGECQVIPAILLLLLLASVGPSFGAGVPSETPMPSAEDPLPRRLPPGPPQDIGLFISRREDINEIWNVPHGRKKLILNKIVDQWQSEDAQVEPNVQVYISTRALADLVVVRLSKGPSPSTEYAIVKLQVYNNTFDSVRKYGKKLKNDSEKFATENMKSRYSGYRFYIIGVARAADVVERVRRFRRKPNMEVENALEDFASLTPGFQNNQIWPSAGSKDNLGYIISSKTQVPLEATGEGE